MTGLKKTRQEDRRAAAMARVRGNQVKVLLFIALAFFVLILLVSISFRPGQPLAPPEVIALGASVYQESCASCHGDQGQGHILLEQAPALDSSEHAWHHPDGQIQELILNGGTLMPAFGDTLSDNEVEAVIRFIQTLWTAEQLDSQQRASQDYPLR